MNYYDCDTTEIWRNMGTYYSGDSICVILEIEKDKVTIQEDKNPACECFILNENKFYIKDMNAIIEFKKNTNSERTARIYQGLWLWEVKKIKQ